jgi:hypothetical protein
MPGQGSLYRSGRGARPDEIQLDNRQYMDVEGRVDPERMRRLLLHETQHAVQDASNFGNLGTNPRAAGSFSKYLRNPGEMEARVVEQRRQWTPQSREQFNFPEHMNWEANRLQQVPEPGSYPSGQDFSKLLRQIRQGE